MALITFRQLLNQLMVDATADDPRAELKKTGDVVRRATHAALLAENKNGGLLRGETDDEPCPETDRGVVIDVSADGERNG